MNQIKKTFECQICNKTYKRKSFFEKQVQKCEVKELEAFNYEGLLEHWKEIDPDIANCFEVEMNKILKKK